MSGMQPASIIITSYNYGRYLPETIDSAMSQTYPNTEVIVVDDGSADSSREIIASYGDRIIPVLKENGGQGSAFNAGFSISRGEVILFLDSDDALLPSAVERAVNLFHEPNVVKVHWPLWVIDRLGRKTGRTIPKQSLPDGDLRDLIIRDGPASYHNPPTTGNAWSRSFLKKVMPVPEAEFRINTDTYLFTLAPLFGSFRKISEPQGYYRIHSGNQLLHKRLDEKLGFILNLYDFRCRLLSKYLSDLGIESNPESWKAKAWWPRVDRSIQEITRLVPEGMAFILVDGDGWGTDEFIAGRRRIPFIEREGKYWGAPSDDETAIGELERLRGTGAGHIVFGWPVFWWFDYLRGFHNYVRSRHRCVLENDRIVVFDLRP
ncbi:MAG: glycosyltransferase [Acidobacteriota bacterium]